MKKSNIILIIILGIFVLMLVAMQLKVKSNILNIKKTVLNYNNFSTLEVDSGWYVELYYDTLARITIDNEGFKDYISSQNGKLILKKLNHKSSNKNVIKISNPRTQQITISGNSTVSYYNPSIDSLVLQLSNHSYILIDSEKTNNNKNQIRNSNKSIIDGNIEYLDFNAANKSRINLYCNVHNMKGILNDTCSFFIHGKISKSNLEKSQESNLSSW